MQFVAPTTEDHNPALHIAQFELDPDLADHDPGRQLKQMSIEVAATTVDQVPEAQLLH